MKAFSLISFLFFVFVSSFAVDKKHNEIFFTENKGQLKNTEGAPCDDILFHADAAGMAIFLKNTGISYVFQSYPIINEHLKNSSENTAEDLLVKAHRVDLHFVGGNTNPQIIKQKQQTTVFNFYSESASVENANSYKKISYKEIYKHIDVDFYTANSGNIKYDFIVNPKGNPDDIGLYYLGAESVSIDDDGVLKVTTSLGNITESIPKVYQQIDGVVYDVNAHYIIENDIVKIKTGTYNKNYSLIIDPWVTFFGGSNNDSGEGIDVDNNGNTIIVGYTNPTLFPITPGAFQTTGGGDFDIFLSKFDNNGTLVFSTFLGGVGEDLGHAVACDASGNIFITGYLTSSGLGTAGVVQPNRSGNSDAVIAKFNSTGGRVWLTYHGGGNRDAGTSIDIDNAGNVVVGGHTMGGATTTAGCFQPAYAGTRDAFLLKLNTTGTTRLFSTYIGGAGGSSQSETIHDIDINPVSNDITVSGITPSPSFPVSAGAHQTVYGGGLTDGFIGRFDANGTRIWLTYFGGTKGDAGFGAAFDNLGDLVFCGTTQSGDLPTTASSFQPALAVTTGGAFFGKFNSGGILQWVTYYGTTASEGFGVAINKTNNDIYISGNVYWAGLPAWNCAFQVTDGGGVLPLNPGEDHFIARFGSAGNFKCNTYMGGLGHDEKNTQNGGNICYYNGDVYITGVSIGAFPTTTNAYQPTYGGGYTDAIIARICGHTCGDNTVDADFSSSKDTVCIGGAIDFSDISTLCDPSEVTWQWSFQGGTPSSSTQQNPANIIYNTQGSFPVKLVVETPCGMDSIVLNNYVYVSKPNAIVNSNTGVSCFGGSNGGAAVGVTGGVGPFSYSWVPVVGTNSSISNLTAGNYSVTVTDKIGCTSSAATVISEPPLLVVSASTLANAGCSGMAGIVSASVTGGTPGYNYTWHTSPVQLVQTVSNLSVGIYSVTVSDLNGCSTSSTTTVTPSTSPPLVVTILPATISICYGSTAVLTAQASGGGNVYTYNWLPANTGGNTLVVSPSSTTSYSVVVTDNCNSPADTAAIVVNVDLLPEVSFSVSDSAGCGPLCVNFTNTTTNGNSVFWKFGDGASSSQNSLAHCFTEPGSYSIDLTVVSDQGCVDSLTKSNYINVFPNPVAAFSSGPASVNLLEPTVYFTDRSTGASSWLWSFGDVLNSGDSSQHTSFSYPDSGRYTVQLIVQNEFGCVDSVLGEIYINPAFAFYIPNSFSPNNDGLNDVFSVTGMGISEGNFEMLIFDRWGALVFVSEDINKGWDGMIKGAPAIIDTYVWKVALKTLEGKLIRKAGHVNVIR